MLGAGLGAGATVTASWTATRSQRDVVTASRDSHAAEVRRAAYADFLTIVDSFTDRARAVVAAMENFVPLPECEAAFRAYVAEWEELQRKCAPVIIAGPAGAGERAAALRGQLGAMADECDTWYKAHMQGPARPRSARFLEAHQTVGEYRAAFVAAAQAAAYGPAYGPAASAPGAAARRSWPGRLYATMRPDGWPRARRRHTVERRAS